MAESQLAKKVLKEVQSILKTKKFFDDGLATIEFDRNNVNKLKIILLPKHGYFRDSLVKFELDVGKDYPSRKPSVKCLNKIFHPNVSSSSSVCFSMFSGDWKSSFRLVDYVNGLLFHLNHPNHYDPLNSSCVIKNHDQYDKTVQKSCRGERSGYEKICVEGFEVQDSQELLRKYKQIDERNKGASR